MILKLLLWLLKQKIKKKKKRSENRIPTNWNLIAVGFAYHFDKSADS